MAGQKLRVAWIIPGALGEQFPQGQKDAGSGTWVRALLEQVRRDPSVALTVITFHPKLADHRLEKEGVTFINRQCPERLNDWLDWTEPVRKVFSTLTFDEFDLVHIHGTEQRHSPLGLEIKDCPVVWSLQGVLGHYWQNYRGSFDFVEEWRTVGLKDLIKGRGYVFSQVTMRKRAAAERKILQAGRHFMGRTGWDQGIIRLENPGACYWKVGEALREPFFGPSWNWEGCTRQTVFFTNLVNNYKGGDVLIEAVRLLKAKWPALKIRCAGSFSQAGFAQALRRRMEEAGVSECFEFLGHLSAQTIADELRKAQVAINPSFIDNSPNSVGEAQCIGTPVLAADVGGVRSMVEHEVTGLLVPARDAIHLASALDRLFGDESLCRSLSTNALRVARERHAPVKVWGELNEAYKRIAARPND